MDSRDGLETSKIEVRYENLTVKGDAYVGDRALPSLYNATFNSIQVSGNVTYCGHQLSEFIPQRTCAYISPNNLHTGEMTVRETLDFSGRCLGVGPKYKLLSEILKMEKEERNAFPNGTTQPGTETNLIIDYVLKLTFMSLVGMAMFFRTTMPVGSLENGIKFFGALFFGLHIVMFNGMAELSLTVVRLPIFYKQRDSLLYPAWAFALPIWLLRIPLSLMESGIWVVLTYYTIGFAPDATRFGRQFLTFFAIHQVALSLFRLLAAVARTEVLSYTLGPFTLMFIGTLGGFVVAKDDSKPWMSWGFYASPMMYAQNALVLDEFLDKRWSRPNIDPQINASTVGTALLKSRSFYTQEYWFWICLAILLRFSIIFNILFIVALTFLNPIVDAKHVIREESYMENTMNDTRQEVYEGIDMAERSTSQGNNSALVAPRGLTIEQRKRLTIAVELVANPSIIFMDEPTSGLDARAAAIVMRTVRNTVDTGRTVLCTIHQPSIDIFESFDELLLMKIGGQIIFAGPLGHQSHKLVEYFQAIPGVPKIKNGHNPATWVLDVTSSSAETQLNVDYAQIYANSILYEQQLQDLLDLSGGLYAVVVFLGAVNINTVQPIVAVERTVFYRERAAGMYSSLPYALSQQIPIWCRWYYWANPLSWTLYGLLTSQVGQDNHTFEILGAGNTTIKGFIKGSFGYDYDFLPGVAIAHVGWILIFFFAFVYAIKAKL
ncbi:pleiotropic drug resistance protein 2 [Artemisia annua]|uniref:Pleiotropic drug resistance protein 2 n=1 Tax=Artemisia annua TaxID=35608 RepID=A0A2U1NIE9_ARTAN|nr:pleiotropic drug resistance protein 2 [Artemisia annua]